MSDRIIFTNDTRLSTAMLNGSFDALEKADQRFLMDMGVFGVVEGLDVAVQEGLWLKLAPGLAYDQRGQRIMVPAPLEIDCSRDAEGKATAVSAEDRERWLTVAIKFARRDEDPVLEKYGRVVARRRMESYSIVLRRGDEGPAGLAERAPHNEDEMVVCDVRIAHAKEQLEATDIDLSHRSSPLYWKAANIAAYADKWHILPKAAVTVQDALNGVEQAMHERSQASVIRFDDSESTFLKRCVDIQKALVRVDGILEEHHLTIEADHQQLNIHRDETQGVIKKHEALFDGGQRALAEVKEAIEALSATERLSARRQDAILQLAARFETPSIQSRQTVVHKIPVPSLLRSDVLLNVSPIDKRSGLNLAIEALSYEDGWLELRLENRTDEALESRQVIIQVVVGMNTRQTSSGEKTFFDARGKPDS